MKKTVFLLAFAFVSCSFASLDVFAGSSTIEFEVTELTVVENDDQPQAYFQIRRTGDLSEPASVVLSTVDGTAIGEGP